MSDYKYYMIRSKLFSYFNPDEAISLEEYFQGMKYIKCEGLSTKGKPKNIYVEEFAEDSRPLVYIPEEISREMTEVEFEFVFYGDNRREVYDNFCDWITNYYVRYWDTCRNREVDLLLLEAIEPSEDKLYGSTPYIIANFKFKNINGISTKKE